VNRLASASRSRVVRAVESTPDDAVGVCLDDLLDGTVCASNAHEGAKEEQKDVESVLCLLPQISLVIIGMIVQPQPAR